MGYKLFEPFLFLKFINGLPCESRRFGRDADRKRLHDTTMMPTGAAAWVKNM
jgi:hypothetical protein